MLRVLTSLRWVVALAVLVVLLDSGTLPGSAVTTITAGDPIVPLADAMRLPGDGHAKPVFARPDGWSSYRFDVDGTGFDPESNAITEKSAGSLKVAWVNSSTRAAGGSSVISAQPVYSAGRVYWGGWNGYEYAANATTGKLIWRTFVGQDRLKNCSISPLGVAGAATVGTIDAGPRTVRAVFVPGGDGRIYALRADNGKVIWKTRVADIEEHEYLWSSPVDDDERIFIGIASQADCPLINGRLVRLDADTGKVTGVVNMVPDDCVGGSIWGTPAIDEKTQMLFTATGNPAACGQYEPYGQAMVAVSLTSMAVDSAWRVPVKETVFDSDFGASPTLFTAKIGGTERQMVGLVNKNGIFYAFNRSNVRAGPVWKATVAKGGDCPECDTGSISSAAFDGQSLYVAGGRESALLTSCAASLRALNPATGKVRWKRCLPSAPALGAISALPGLVIATAGPYIVIVRASDGKTLRQYNAGAAGAFDAGVTIANGWLYAANTGGQVVALKV